MLISNRENEWKRRFAIFPVPINENGDLVWLQWYEVRGPMYARERRLPGASESAVRSDI